MATKASSELAARYAAALIDLAHEGQQTESVLRDVEVLSHVMEGSPLFGSMLKAYAGDKGFQAEVITNVAEKARFSELTKGFLGVLMRNRRLYALKPVLDAIKSEMAIRRGEQTVYVQTAEPLTPAQLQALKHRIAEQQKNPGALTIKASVDPALIGGMVVTIGSKMIDDSVRHKLERLKAAMARQANENAA